MYAQGQIDFKREKYKLAKNSLTPASNDETFSEKQTELEYKPTQTHLVEVNHITDEKIDKVVEDASAVLYRCSAVFPFDLWPNEIIIDAEKVSIIYHDFFFSESTYSVYLKDIDTMHIECGPFFATLKITHGGYQGNKISIEYLKKEDGKEARRILQGLIIAEKKGLEFAQESSTEEVKEKAGNIGRVHSVE